MEENKNFKRWTKLIIFGILLYWVLFNLKTVGNIFSSIFSILSPLILGAFIALVLNIPMKFFEEKFKGKKNKENVSLLERALAILLSIIIIVFVIVLVVNLIVPELIKVVKLLINNIPYYREELNNLFNKLQTNHPDFNFNGIKESVNASLDGIVDNLINDLPYIMSSSLKIARGIFSGLAQFIIALVFAFYLLTGKDRLKKQWVRFAHTYLKGKADKVIKVLDLLINNYGNFIGAQCVEAIILGSLCTIGMLIIGLPYAVTIGVVIGVTALIPIVGAFVGMGVGAILILSVSPIKVIVFIVFLTILQQIETNIIYPRVVGKKTGLPGMWVLVSVIIGGSIHGVIGMLLAVPIGTTIHTLVTERMDKYDNNKKLEVKN